MATDITKLMNDILLNIFSFLPSAELKTARQVSKHWHDLLAPEEVQIFMQQLQNILRKHGGPAIKQKDAAEKLQPNIQAELVAVANDTVHFYLFNKKQKIALINELQELAKQYNDYGCVEDNDKASTFLNSNSFANELGPLYSAFSQYLRGLKAGLKETFTAGELDSVFGLVNEAAVKNALFQMLNSNLGKEFILMLLGFLQGEITGFSGDKLEEILKVNDEVHLALALNEEVKKKDYLNNTLKSTLVAGCLVIGIIALPCGIAGLAKNKNQTYSILALSLGVICLILAAGFICGDELRKKKLKQSKNNVFNFFKIVDKENRALNRAEDETLPLLPEGSSLQNIYLGV